MADTGDTAPMSDLRALALLPLRILYTLYAGSVFLTLSLSAVLGVLLVPSLTGRRNVVRWVARTFLRLSGMPLRVAGIDQLPLGQCIVVANHSSYLDGVVCKAVLPSRFGYVIKREMNGVPLAGLLLRRIGSEFVERFDRHRGAKDARRVLRTASNGHSLVFFPEGTFTPTPGLAKFHTGAFVTAARAGCPVVPMVIRGTRRALPPARALLWPHPIEVELLAPLETAGSDNERIAALVRDRARSAILVRLGEPDLQDSRLAATR
jgi:1-acyl-sn-glycerol-3-phosphate acyltransferase